MAFLAAAVPAVIGALGSAGTAAAGAGGLSLGATALSAGGGVFSALMEKRAADYNARVADIQAAQAAEQGALKASELTRRNTQASAAARAAAASSGFESTGSIADLLRQQERQQELDVLTAVYDGTVQSMSSKADAKLNRSRGRSALAAGVIGAGSQSLTGLSNFYDRRTRKASI